MAATVSWRPCRCGGINPECVICGGKGYLRADEPRTPPIPKLGPPQRSPPPERHVLPAARRATSAAVPKKAPPPPPGRLAPSMMLRVRGSQADTRVEDLHASSCRLEAALGAAGIQRLGDLDGRSVADVARVRGVGRESLRELLELLVRRGALELPVERLRPTFGVPAFAHGFRFDDLAMPLAVRKALGSVGLTRLGQLDTPAAGNLPRRVVEELVRVVAEVRARGPELPAGFIGTIDEAVDQLDDRLRRVLLLRFGGSAKTPEAFKVIAPHLGVTAERARQLEEGAIDRVRVIAGPVFMERLREVETRSRADNVTASELLDRRRRHRRRSWAFDAFYVRVLQRLAPGLELATAPRSPAGRAACASPKLTASS